MTDEENATSQAGATSAPRYSGTKCRLVIGIVTALVAGGVTFAITALKKTGSAAPDRVPLVLQNVDLDLTAGGSHSVDGDLSGLIQSVVVANTPKLTAPSDGGACPQSAESASILPAGSGASAPLGVDTVLWTSGCPVKVTPDAVTIESRDGGSCNVGGAIALASASAPEVTSVATDGGQPHCVVSPGATVRWEEARTMSLRLLRTSTSASPKIVEQTGDVRSFEGRLGADFSYRPNWRTVCAGPTGARVRVSGVAGSAPIAGPVKFAGDSRLISLSISPDSVVSLCSGEHGCESACGTSLWDLLSDWLPFFFGAFGFLAGFKFGKCAPAATAMLLLTSVGVSSCASRKPGSARPERIRAGDDRAQRRRSNAVNPLVAVVAAGAPCTGAEKDIHDVTAADAKLFGDASLTVETMAPNEGALEAAIRRLARDGSTRHGLVLYYTGHAEIRQSFSETEPDAAGVGHAPQTHLCLTGGTLPVRRLVRWLQREPRDQLPWAVLILDACESAFVDIGDATMPISILAASPEPVATYTSAWSPTTRVAPFARAVVAALSRPEQYDSNHDGIVTDREVLHAVTEIVDRDASDAALPARPRLQRQATSSLPVRFYDPPSGAIATVAAVAEELSRSRDRAHRELGQALAHQLGLSRGALLPRLDWDFVVAQTPIATVPCSDGDGPQDPPWSCLAGRPDLRVLDPALTESARAIARFLTSADLYAINQVQGRATWFNVINLRDGRIMASTRKSPVELVPRRTAVLSRTADRADWLVRTTEPIERATGDCRGRTPERCEVMSLNRRFTVCEEEEGQCFTASR